MVFISPIEETFFFNDKKINDLGPVKIARLGISRTFQNVELYRNMTVLENVMVGRYAKTKSGFFSCGFRLPGMVKEEKEIRKISEELLEYVGLYDKKDYLAGELPIGSQRILEIARALATEPKLIMFDEPASGLNDAETKDLSLFIKRLRDEKGLTVILVEHDMGLVMDISDNIVVLNFGEKLAEGTPEEIRNNKSVIDAYLGEEEELF